MYKVRLQALARVTLLGTVGFLMAAVPVQAEELIIEGNGADSSSNISIDANQEKTVEQTNEAKILNEVEVKADTGNNTADNNTGDVNIETGDVSTDTSIEQDVNNSVIDTSSGNSSGGSAVISGNGSGSENGIETSSNSETRIEVEQNARVNNTVKQRLNTGDNSASGNNGSVSIDTGSIFSETAIKNGVNRARISVGCCNGKGEIDLKIKGNGADSKNMIRYMDKRKVEVVKDEYADIINEVEIEARTGGNKADSNAGQVDIVTGDVVIKAKVENAPVNENWIKVICDCPKDGNGNGDDDGNGNGDGDGDGDGNGNGDDNGPPPPPPPANGGNGGVPGNGNGGNGGNGNGGIGGNGGGGIGGGITDAGMNGQVLGAGIGGGILPATGTSSLLLWIAANILTLLMGAYLKFRAGRSPDTGVAIAAAFAQ